MCVRVWRSSVVSWCAEGKRRGGDAGNCRCGCEFGCGRVVVREFWSDCEVLGEVEVEAVDMMWIWIWRGLVCWIGSLREKVKEKEVLGATSRV